MEAAPEKPKLTPVKLPGKRLDKRELISIAFELGFIIALPIVALGFAGKWLDARSNTEPLFTLLGILLAIVSTSVWIYRKFKEYFK
ncbi:MAG: hypothetical protein A2751_05095 [Candidatus Doudnabacteria bacterium RIFCSPHIGHO2_01_FULL_46_14]|uniref:AtpZ/AtpI family protein n=1 Tax=Candidatus Doudnabacteria bacterium RIFCSPHIGHO2_01_FULL_46_14 TaxID=1817824 RepID=A0A1F5NNS6_9BACT|nr:MAG: hypothetical protein A2751_05095 [Candidatus Doudnabacteria bacterium RIFCSPHIGHO2_01_FULL_46_14]